ncbi:magnesium-translocating P-type ATPase [Sphaerisporangium dianthi]|uniref:Magnesium-transporting ATPase, P-type 1 n=1 Tax=Sphaerisporangium dianthi TaxID=1436120 RepID=A0ABV9CBW5_9ACTN
MGSTTDPVIVASAPGGPVSEVARAAALPAPKVLADRGVTAEVGLSQAEVARRRARYGPNTVSSHRARWLPVLWHQSRSPLLGLLLAAVVVSYLVGERSDAVIIGLIIAGSVGLGFVNEYRAERAAEALHSQIRHQTEVVRDGAAARVDVTGLVPGDLVRLRLGDIVPADLRLFQVDGLACDESVLTGESSAVDKSTAAVPGEAALAELSGCALMGTVVHAGGGSGVVVATGSGTEFGKIAAGLGTRQLETQFQVGLRRFSMLLVYVAATLTTSIFLINVVLHKPIIDALLFSLAIAVGITPQLLPAVVSTSLAAGARRMSRRKVLVKRLVCIEDLGDVEVLFTDKTGTLTRGRIDYLRAVPAAFENGAASATAAVLRLGLLCTEGAVSGGQVGGGNPLDQALWDAPDAAGQRDAIAGCTRLGVLPFDHQRRMVSVLVGDTAGHRLLITKGAPESVLERCVQVPPRARQALEEEFAAGNRVVAVATRPAADVSDLDLDDERGLSLAGLLVFADPPKPEAATALARLSNLGIAVKVVTGDNPAVAVRVCQDLGLGGGGVLTGAELDALDDEGLRAVIATTTVFARVTPEHKARIVHVQRSGGAGVAFLGDGVNDALALHAADVGISVDSATDIAKDAADVILLEKDLGVLADGVAEGRRIFANTIKYVLMGTSSNFGNMASAAGASLFLTFLPMLPSQILLNNLLYDTSQLAIPTDNADEEQLRRPSHWDISFIRRFMICFGPLSSVFDFATFAVMLGVFHAGPAQFRSGWFVESLATQTLVIFAIRTRRVPFFRSRPSLPLALAAIGVVVVGALLPATPPAHALGFQPLPGAFFAALAAMVAVYLVLIEIGKRFFYGAIPVTLPMPPRYGAHRHLRRRSARFSTARRRRGGRDAVARASRRDGSVSGRVG